MRYTEEMQRGTKEEKKAWYRFTKLLTLAYKSFKGQPKKEVKEWLTHVCDTQGIDSAEQLMKGLRTVWFETKQEKRTRRKHEPKQ